MDEFQRIIVIRFKGESWVSGEHIRGFRCLYTFSYNFGYPDDSAENETRDTEGSALTDRETNRVKVRRGKLSI